MGGRFVAHFVFKGEISFELQRKMQIHANWHPTYISLALALKVYQARGTIGYDDLKYNPVLQGIPFCMGVQFLM